MHASGNVRYEPLADGGPDKSTNSDPNSGSDCEWNHLVPELPLGLPHDIPHDLVPDGCTFVFEPKCSTDNLAVDETNCRWRDVCTDQ
jgi:hypothetical protein